MKYLKLEEIANLDMGKTPARNNLEYWNGNNTWVSISDLKDKYISESKEKITDKAISDTKIKEVPKNTLIISFKLSIGKKAITTKKLFTNEAIMALKIKDENELDVEYLYYALEKVDLIRYTDKAAKGKTLNKEKLKKIEIPICDMYKQKKIVKSLNKVKMIISKKREQLESLENLKKSQFFEMFGDPIKNEKGWKVTSLDEISIKKGEYGSNKPSKIYEGGYRYIRITDIKENGDLKEEKVGVVDEDIEVKKYKLEEGDILFARSGATVGKTFLYRKEFGNCIFAGYLIRFKLDISKVNPEYIKRYTETEYYKKWVESCQNVVAQPNINAKKYGKELKMILPPLELQNKFATKIEAIQKLKFEIEKSLKETENLYNSLMQKFFSNK